MDLNDLSRKGLISLVGEYDKYIKDICDDEENIINRYPVCVNEYLNNGFLINKTEEQYKLKVVSFEEDYHDLFTETAADVMDVFENILAEHDIKLPSEDRQGEENEAMIFGETYYNMESEVEDLIYKCVKQICDDVTNNLKI